MRVMPKYPEVAQLFRDLFADDLGTVDTDTRKALMAATERSNATVSRWISGEARPETDTWHSIAHTAGVSVNEVISALRPTAERIERKAEAARELLGGGDTPVTAAHLAGFAAVMGEAVTQLRADLGHLTRRVDALARVVEGELGIELASLLDAEESTATPDETGPDGAARPGS